MESMVVLKKRRYVVRLKQKNVWLVQRAKLLVNSVKTRQTGESMDAPCRQGVMCVRVAITTLQRTNTVP